MSGPPQHPTPVKRRMGGMLVIQPSYTTFLGVEVHEAAVIMGILVVVIILLFWVLWDVVREPFL